MSVAQTAEIPEDSPYPGIEPFSFARRGVFFSRENEVRTLVRLIVMYPGVLLYSDSGRGKSSLINAGLVPAIMEEGYRPERIRVQARVGEEIIVERLSKGIDGKPPYLPSIFAPDDDAERTVLSIDEFQEIVRHNTEAGLLLIFDQFEEWNTLFEEASTKQSIEETRRSQERILETLVWLINDMPVKVLISLREDYLAKLAPLFERCPTLPDCYLRLTSMTGEQIYRVIRGAFEKYPGLYRREISSSLARTMEAEMQRRSGPSGVPLTEVQIVCQYLFEASEQSSPEELFSRAGGVRGILERYLEQSLEVLSKDQRDCAIGLLTRMVTPAGTRNVISRDDLISRVANEDNIPRSSLTQTLDQLDQKTKLVQRQRRNDVDYFEISSEFLVDWIRGKAQERQLAAERRSMELERAQRRRRLVLRIAPIVVVVMLLVIGLLAYQQTRVAKSQAMSTSAVLAMDNDPELSLRLSAKAVEWWPTPAANRAVRQALSASHVRLHLNHHKGSVADASFSPDGLRMVTAGGDMTACIWDASGEVVSELSGHTGKLNSAAFSNDGTRVVTASSDKTARVWDAVSGKQVAELSGHADTVNTAVFSPDGSRVVTASNDNTARIWDATSGRLIVALRGHTASVNAAAFSPDGGRVVTASDDRTARIWNARSGKLIVVLRGHTGGLNTARFNPDGTRIVTASEDGSARIWDAVLGRLIIALLGHIAEVSTATFSPDGTSVVTAGGLDRTARIWDASSGKQIAELSGHINGVNTAAFSPDGSRVVTSSIDNTARIWDAASGKLIVELRGHTGAVNTAVFSPDGTRVVTASDDHSARVWAAYELKRVTGLRLQSGSLLEAAFSLDGTRVVTSRIDGNNNVWVTESGMRIPLVDDGVLSLSYGAFNADGSRIVAAGEDGKLRIWDTASGKLITKLEHENEWIVEAAFSPNGRRIVTAAIDKPARIRDSSGNVLPELSSNDKETVAFAAFSPDATRVIAITEARADVYILDVALGKVIFTIPGPVLSAVFSPDASKVVTVTGNTGTIWQTAQLQPIARLQGHTAVVRTARFSPDGNWIVTVSDDHTARIWEASTGFAIAQLAAHSREVLDATFSADSTRVLVISIDGAIETYQCDLCVSEPLQLARQRATRSLTENELIFYPEAK